MDNDIVLAFEDAAMEQAYQTTNSAQAKWQDIGAQMVGFEVQVFLLAT